jgi:hypothetical protein
MTYLMTNKNVGYMKKALLTMIAPFTFVCAHAQTKDTTALFKELKAKDSLLFTAGYNNCDIAQFEKLVSDNFEFYHDEAGITSSKAEFIKGIKEGLCKLSYKPYRKLIESSLVVYPLKKKGVLYGAVQEGVHEFYAIEKDKPRYLTSTAKFTMVWLLENGEWKLSRVLSYDHVVPLN